MGLFDEILSAVNNPDQQANSDQLGAILGTVQQVAGGQSGGSDMTQMMMSVLGGHLRSSLQSAGPEQAMNLVNQFSGTSANQGAVDALLTPVMQQQVVQDLIGRTGLSPEMVQGMLPTLVPLALQFLQGGAQGGATQASAMSNPVLSAFLDGDRDGDVDLGDALGMASQFLGSR